MSGAAGPKSLGFSPERLQRITEHLEKKYVSAGKLAGAVALISRKGELAHSICLGMADVERAVPMKETDIFRIYSMTKPLTSVAVMMLVEQGLVALEDPVSKFIPEFADLKVFNAGVHPNFVTKPCERPMQVIDLLRHTSGLTYGFQFKTNVDAAYRAAGVEGSLSGMPLEDFIKELGKMPLDFSPGTAWNYSVSTDVLGYLVQVVSGMPFQDYLHKHLIDPLGMKDTSFEVPADKAGRFVSCYARGPDGKTVLQDDCKTSKYLAAPAFYSGGGGLCSTAADYMIFCQMLLNGGQYNGKRYISRKTLALMTSNHLPGGKDLTALSRSMFSEATNAGIGFGLGFAVNIDPAAAMISSSKGEFYWGGAASTAFWVDPAEDLAVVFMTQLMPSSAYPIRRELRTLVYAALDD